MSIDTSRFFRLSAASVALLIAVATDAQCVSPQESAPPAAKQEDDRAARLDEMKQIAGSFQAAAIDGGTRVPAAMVRDPLYRWNDPTREFSDGTLWFWRSAGRPIAVVAIELYPQNKAFGIVWALEFTSLSTGPIEVEGGEHFDTYANGTNPEILLRIEARHRRGGSPSWSYAAAPLSRAEVILSLDRQVVWTHKSKTVPSPEDKYFLARRPRNPSARE